MSDLKREIAEAANLINQLTIDHSVKHTLAVDRLIRLNREEAAESARLEQCEHISKILLSYLRNYNDSHMVILADHIEKYPGAWGLDGKIIPLEMLGFKSIEKKEDKDIPHVQVGKAGGSRAAGVPAVVDQDSAEIRARSTRTMP